MEKKLDKTNRLVALGGGLFATFTNFYIYTQKPLLSPLTTYLMVDLFLTAGIGESLPITSRIEESVYTFYEKMYEKIKKYFE